MAARPTHSNRRKFGSIAALVTALLILPACYETQVVRSSWDTLRADQRKSAALDPSVNPGEGWAILLQTFEGSNRDKQASRLIDRLTLEVGMPDLWKADAKGKTNVYRGRYPDENSRAAKQDLRQTRLILFDGKRSFEHVDLVNLSTGQASLRDGGAFDLRRYPGRFTLQIGYYDEMFPEFRKAAEKAAAELRAQGEEAYFYHGPTISLITIGLFDDSDLAQVDGKVAYGPRIKEIQKRFPHNLGNGLTIVEKIRGKKVREQPSVLVKVD